MHLSGTLPFWFFRQLFFRPIEGGFYHFLLFGNDFGSSSQGYLATDLLWHQSIFPVADEQLNVLGSFKFICWNPWEELLHLFWGDVLVDASDTVSFGLLT